MNAEHFPTWSMPLWSQYLLFALPIGVIIVLIIDWLYPNNNACVGCGNPLDIVAKQCDLSYCLECLRPKNDDETDK